MTEDMITASKEEAQPLQHVGNLLKQEVKAIDVADAFII